MTNSSSFDSNENSSWIGQSVSKLESVEKVTGTAVYTHHKTLPNMLYGKIFRSTVAHGLIVNIETSLAKSLPGVFGVYTGEDLKKVVAEPYYGPAFSDQPALALGKVRYVGEPVAVVLSHDPHVAESAVKLIEAEYKELDAIFDEVEAQTSNIFVHDELKPSGIFPDLQHLVGRKNTNLALDFHLKKGDPEQVFASAEHVFEHTFKTQPVMHTPLEPIVAVATASSGRMVIYTATQNPSFIRTDIARMLAWSESQVQIVVPFLGGGFGSKLYVKMEALVACLTLLVNLPVKISLSMEEQFYTITKHATTCKIKSAVSADGKILARKCQVWWNGGAYADIGPRVAQKSGFTAAGPYDIEHVDIESMAMYTNLPPAGALRGFGIPQLVWAYESHTDIIARELGLDPVALRSKNLLQEGMKNASGMVMRSAELEKVLARLAAKMNWDADFDTGQGTVLRGRGIGIAFKAVVAPTTSTAIVNVFADGSCAVLTSTVDMGQGSNTVLAQMVAEILTIPIERVRVVFPDTDVTPYDMGTLSSRSTFHMGHAVRLAAEDAKSKIISMAKEAGMQAIWPLLIGDIFKSKYGMQAGTVSGFGSYKPAYVSPDKLTGQSSNIAPFWMVGATGVEISVDTETGHLSIDRLVNVVDCGKVINPDAVNNQLTGATMMQLGFTLFEKMDLDNGQVTNASFADYKICGIKDLLIPIENECIETPQPNAPFGAKGVGESATFCLSPAIANALEHATGVRITSLPMTPEVVFNALNKFKKSNC